MGFKKFSPVQFGQKYLEALDKGIIQKIDIIKYMKISSATFYAYWKDPEYRAQTKKTIEKFEHKVKELKLGTNHREKIIETAYRLHERGIADAISQKSWAKARKISIDALKICKTEMEIERVFVAIGEVNIQNTQVNIHSEVQVVVDEMWAKLCEGCRAKIKEILK